jgi:3D (Asp-Asp-Asp) domain-containing protein/LysM repeat protein
LIRNRKKTGFRRSAALLLGSTLFIGGALLPGASASAAETAASTAVYTAKSGDTFWNLSRQFGIPLQSLLDANPDVNPLNIYSGLKLNIPQATQVYTAREGDTFWNLSVQFGIPLQSLLDANPDVDPLNIYAGLKLHIPSAAISAGEAPKTAADAKIAEGTPAPQQQAEAVQAITTATGETLEFVKVLDVKATAYSDSSEENKWGPVDYFGNPLKLGTIAVDPKVIPFGTRVYITGYNFDGLPKGGLIATATDTGSAIKGNRIDIFVPGKRSYVATFGVQDVKVYILK